MLHADAVEDAIARLVARGLRDVGLRHARDEAGERLVGVGRGADAARDERARLHAGQLVELDADALVGHAEVGQDQRQQIVVDLALAADADRRQAQALFGSVSGDRARVYESYKSALALKPVPANGRAVFRRDCAQCHRLDQEGSAVGPDLFGIRNQAKEAILLHILVPDQEISPGFTAYSVSTQDGRVLAGLIASETPTTLTFRQPLGKEDTIARDEIDQLAASKQSLMPQGLEKSISHQEMADLLAFLKGEAAGAP